MIGLLERSTSSSCPLLSVNHRLTLSSFAVRHITTLKYRNPHSDRSAEFVYRFARSVNSTLYSISIELFDPKTGNRKVLNAKIRPREVAREMYDDAVASGSSVAMVAETISDTDSESDVSLMLGCIGPDWEVTVTLQSIEVVRMEWNNSSVDGGSGVVLKWNVPSRNYCGSGSVAGASKVVELHCDVVISELHGRIRQLECGSHPDEVEIVMESSGEEGLASSGKIQTPENVRLTLEQDIELSAVLESVSLVSGRIELHCDEREDEGEEQEQDDSATATATAVISVLPKFEALEQLPLCTELVVICDCSGSMRGPRILSARRTIDSLFRHAFAQGKNRNVWVNLVRFGTNFELFSPTGSKELNQGTVDELAVYLEDKLKADLGGTRILRVVTEVLGRDVVQPGFSRQVMLITDGEDSRTQDVIDYVRKNASTTRFFTFGIGSGVNPVLITRVAEVSHGRSAFVSGSDSDEIEEAVLQQLRYSLQPSMTNLTVEFSTGEGEIVRSEPYVKIVPPCYNMQNLVLFHRLFGVNKAHLSKDGGGIRALVHYGVGGDSRTAAIVLRESEEQLKLKLRTLACQQRVNELDDGKAWQSFASSADEVLEEVKHLGLAGHFLTSQTSFVMVWESGDEVVAKKPMALEMIPDVVATEDEIREVFQLFDVSESHSIGLDEMKQVMQCLGERIPDEELLKLFPESEPGVEPTICFEEFQRLFRPTHAAGPPPTSEIDPSCLKRSATLGCGAFGSVVAAKMKIGISELEVAIKRLPLPKTPAEENAFRRHVNLCQTLNHPNLVKCFGMYTEGSGPHSMLSVVYERFGSDFAYYRRHNEFSASQKIQIMLGVTKALQYLFARGIGYQGFSYEEILFSPPMTVKITLPPERSSSSIVGTPETVPPEILKMAESSSQTGSRSSLTSPPLVFALGIVFWRIWTGKRPYEGKEALHNPFLILRAVAEDGIRPSLELCLDMPENVRVLMERCWDADPGIRPEFDEIVGVLESIQK